MKPSDPRSPRAGRWLAATVASVVLGGVFHAVRIAASVPWQKIALGGAAGACMGLSIAFGLRYAAIKRASGNRVE